MDFYFYISRIVYVKTIESISNVFSSLNEFVEADDSSKIDYGLDTEFTTDQLCTVQVAVKGRTAIVADIFNAGVRDSYTHSCSYMCYYDCVRTSTYLLPKEHAQYRNPGSLWRVNAMRSLGSKYHLFWLLEEQR